MHIDLAKKGVNGHSINVRIMRSDYTKNEFNSVRRTYHAIHTITHMESELMALYGNRFEKPHVFPKHFQVVSSMYTFQYDTIIFISVSILR